MPNPTPNPEFNDDKIDDMIRRVGDMVREAGLSAQETAVVGSTLFNFAVSYLAAGMSDDKAKAFISQIAEDVATDLTKDRKRHQEFAA